MPYRSGKIFGDLARRGTTYGSMPRKEVLAVYTDIAIAALRKYFRDVGRGWSRNILIVRAAYHICYGIFYDGSGIDMLRDMLQGVFSHFNRR